MKQPRMIKFRETRIPIKRLQNGGYEKAGKPEALEIEIKGKSARKIAQSIKGLPSLQLYELKKTGMTVIMEKDCLVRIELVGHEHNQESNE